MKKFNVKALSLAVAAAVVSGAAAAEEVNFAQAVGGKPDQGQAAFFTVFGEGTTYDKGTGKLTFKKDSDALLLKTLELEQTINGFASGSNFITTDANGNKTVREATNEDIEADSLKGVGLAGGLTAVNARVDNLAKETSAALDDQDETIEQLKTAITTNGTRIAEVATGVNDLNKSVTKMGEDISSKFDEVDSEISKASSELSESIEKVSEDVTAVNTRVDSLAQDAADAKANAKAAEDKVTALSANVDSKVKEAKDAADKAKDASDKAVDAASKIDAVADKADKASKGVAGLTEALEKVAEQSALAAAENTQALNGFAEGDEIVVTDADGIKSVKKATKEDVEQDEFGGLGLKEVVAQHDQSLADLTAETERAKKAAEQAAFAAIENAQELNGFKEKDEIIVTDDNGVKSVKTATNEDVEADEFKGLGLKEVVAAHDEALGDLTETVNENSEALVKTAEVVNAISADVNANKAALEEQKEANEGFNNAIASLDKDIGDLASAGKAAMEALEVNRQDIDANKTAIETKADKADFEELAKYTADMGKKVNDIGDEVTALSDATNAAITRHDKDIVDLAQAGLKATEALEANRKDIDANKAAIAENTAKLEEQKEANEGFNNAIASLDKDIGDLASAGKAAMEALEVNRQDIDANKAAIETKADKADFEELAKYTDNMGKKVNDIGDEVTALSDATNAAITRHDKDIVDLAQAGLKATEALEANRKDIDANKAAIDTNKEAIATKADKADVDELVKYTADMGKKVNDIGDEVTALSDATSAAITRQDKDIVDLAKGLQLAAEAVEDNRKEIDANKAAIETKADKADFEELAKYTADMGKKVNDIGDEVTALSDATSAAITRHDKDIVDLAQAGLKATEALEANRKDIDANKQGIVDLAKGLQLAAEAVEDNRKEIDANKAAIAENTAKLEEQKEANDGFNNAIASLDEDIITLKKADLAAADALKAHRTDIDANKAAIETKADKTAVESVRTIAVEAQKSAQVAKSAVEVAQKSAETADSHAKAAQTAAAKAQESADTNAVQIAANTKQIDTNKTDIAALQTANGQHAAGIAKNSARIDSLDKNVANLRKETRQGLAAQAALSGLFQPYSVGKFNVTAALGGFKSDTAVAVGAGYRFNENFAAKAGLAVGTSSGGSASYNVGLNYEW